MGRLPTLKGVIKNIDKKRKKDEDDDDDDDMMGDPKKHQQMHKNMQKVKKEGCK